MGVVYTKSSHEAVMRIFLFILPLIYFGYTEASDRKGNLLPFQIIKFPNDPCVVTGGTKNGTCYTTEECSDKGGTSGGSCAEGYGVCCQFTLGCGSSSTENCTYFELTTAPTGGCSAQICRASTNICQIRLDFETFVITGPATLTASVNKLIGGTGGDGTEGNLVTRCLSDTFGVSNAPNIPTLCGTLTGEHVYFEASDTCNSLDFAFAGTATGIGSLATRSVKIKVSQLACGDSNLAPVGCTQYMWGTSGAGIVKSFAYDGTNPHLADQAQVICVRREQGNCQICWSADAVADVSLGGKQTKGVVKDSSCCGYGTDGKKSTGGYDCLMIPGASQSGTPKKPSQCGGRGGLVTASGTTGKTVCSKSTPFRLEFFSNSFEIGKANVEGDFTMSATNSKGFKVRYYQAAC